MSKKEIFFVCILGHIGSTSFVLLSNYRPPKLHDSDNKTCVILLKRETSRKMSQRFISEKIHSRFQKTAEALQGILAPKEEKKVTPWRGNNLDRFPTKGNAKTHTRCKVGEKKGKMGKMGKMGGRKRIMKNQHIKIWPVQLSSIWLLYL